MMQRKIDYLHVMPHHTALGQFCLIICRMEQRNWSHLPHAASHLQRENTARERRLGGGFWGEEIPFIPYWSAFWNHQRSQATAILIQCYQRSSRVSFFEYTTLGTNSGGIWLLFLAQARQGYRVCWCHESFALKGKPQICAHSWRHSTPQQ